MLIDTKILSNIFLKRNIQQDSSLDGKNSFKMCPQDKIEYSINDWNKA